MTRISEILELSVGSDRTMAASTPGEGVQVDKLGRGEGTSVDLKDRVVTGVDWSLQERTPRQGQSILFNEPLSHFSPSFAKNSSGGDAGQNILELFLLSKCLDAMALLEL